MTQEILTVLFMYVMGITLILVGALTLKGSWRQGNFIAASLSLGFIIFGLAAVVLQVTGRVDICLWLIGLCVIDVLFVVFVVMPMASRRARKKARA